MDVRIRNLDEWVIESLRQNAKRVGRSLESELRETLTDAVLRRKRAIAAEMRADLEELRSNHGTFANSVPGIRDDRERRG